MSIGQKRIQIKNHLTTQDANKGSLFTRKPLLGVIICITCIEIAKHTCMKHDSAVNGNCRNQQAHTKEAGTVHNTGFNLSLTAACVAAIVVYTHNPIRILLPQCNNLSLPTVCNSVSVLVASKFSRSTMVENIVRITSEYEARLPRGDYVPRFSYIRRMLRDDGDPNRFFLMYLFCEEPTVIQFLKDIGLLRCTMKCNSCGRDMTSADPSVSERFRW